MCALFGLGGIAKRSLRRQWPLPSTGVGLSLTLVALYLQQAWLTWLALCFFGLVIALPVMLSVFAVRCLQRGRLAAAGRWARVRGLVDREWSIVSRVWSLAALHYDGQPDPAERELAEWTASADARALGYRDSLCMLLGHWDTLRYSAVLEYRVRALCELGEVNAGALEFAAAWQGHRGVRRSVSLRRAALPLLAFTGRIDATRTLTELMGLPRATAQFWIYTSQCVRRIDFEPEVSVPTTGFLGARWRQRLENRPSSVALESAADAILDEVTREIEIAHRFRLGRFWRYPVVTTFLALCLCGFFLQHLRGGVYDPIAALSLGALLAEGQFPATPWRLLAYGFLHFGPVHLVTNLLVVLVTGPLVVRVYGQLGFLAISLLGIGTAGIFISYLGEPGVTVGASGGSMALVAAITWAVLGDLSVRRSRWGRFLGSCLVGFLILEVIADLLIPEISFAGHAGGFLGGLLVAVIWRCRPRADRPV